MTTPRFHIIMENTAGKLAERFADNLSSAKQKLIDLIADVVIADGDCFRVVARDNIEKALDEAFSTPPGDAQRKSSQ